MVAIDAIFNRVRSCQRSGRLFLNYMWYARRFYRITNMGVCVFLTCRMTISFYNDARRDVFCNEMRMMLFDKGWYVVVGIISLLTG